MKLKLYEGNDKSLVIQNLSENSVRTKHEVYKILAKGTAKRKTAETQMNAHSSRYMMRSLAPSLPTGFCNYLLTQKISPRITKELVYVSQVPLHLHRHHSHEGIQR